MDQGNIEREPISESKVVLEFIHHAEKEIDQNKDNKYLGLTPKGRRDALDTGKGLDPQVEVSVAWGSPRARSQETSTLIMLANEDIDENMTLTEIKAVIEKELGKNKKKIIEDSRLDFKLDGPGIGEWSSALYKQGESFMLEYIRESDQRALDTNDRENDTYTRKAAEIAEIILRYSKVGDTFNRIISKTDKYKANNNQLERYLGTHGSVIEPLVAKVVEKLNGVEARDELSKALGKGFSQTKGFRVEIINNGTEQNIVISFEVDGARQEYDININLLEEIIQDREEYELKFKK